MPVGRPRKDKRLDTVKDNLLNRLVTEKEPKLLVDLLVAYFQLVDIIEHEKQLKNERKINRQKQ
jgi:hypothetical protein